MYRRPMRQWNNQNYRKINAEVWFAIIVNIAAVWINYTNLQYNKMQAYQSSRVADQLSRLNQSNLMIDINNKINSEKGGKT